MLTTVPRVVGAKVWQDFYIDLLLLEVPGFRNHMFRERSMSTENAAECEKPHLNPIGWRKLDFVPERWMSTVNLLQKVYFDCILRNIARMLVPQLHSLC